MENVCDRMLELDQGKAFMHKFGGPGSYEQFKEVGQAAGAAKAVAAEAGGMSKGPLLASFVMCSYDPRAIYLTHGAADPAPRAASSYERCV